MELELFHEITLKKLLHAAKCGEVSSIGQFAKRSVGASLQRTFCWHAKL